MAAAWQRQLAKQLCSISTWIDRYVAARGIAVRRAIVGAQAV